MPDFITSDLVPNGIDWADGLDGRPGTATPPGANLSNPPLDTIFEENPDSPEIERGEQGTIQHRFTMSYDNGLTFLAGLGRGVFLQDSAGNITRVVTSRLTKQSGNRSNLTVTAESISFDTPPDDFRIEIIELNPALEKHPRYGFIPAAQRALVNAQVTAAQQQGQTEALNLINTIAMITNPATPPLGTWSQVQDACNELLLKRRIGEDTFYLPGFRITWSQYFWKPPVLNPGGYIEDPIAQGGLPAYFWSLDQTEDGLSIFDAMSDINPQFYSEGISWLRQSDYTDYQRTWFRETHTWIGAPFAHWDDQIYTREPSPYPAPPSRPLS